MCKGENTYLSSQHNTHNAFENSDYMNMGIYVCVTDVIIYFCQKYYKLGNARQQKYIQRYDAVGISNIT
jgi:hypothetical protein